MVIINDTDIEKPSSLPSGDWSDLHADGIVDIDIAPVIAKAILTFIYTGALDSDLLEHNTHDLLCAACEFMLGSLKDMCELQLAQTLTKDIVRPALVTSYLHGCEQLMAACFKFIRQTPGIVTNRSFMSLATEHPELWRRLTVALGGEVELGEQIIGAGPAETAYLSSRRSDCDIDVDVGAGEADTGVGGKRKH